MQVLCKDVDICLLSKISQFFILLRRCCIIIKLFWLDNISLLTGLILRIDDFKLNMALFNLFRSVVFPIVKAEDEEAEIVDPHTALRVHI